ncbi:MAG: winged helix-turn-helix transcriptional regulator [Acidobacteria bacterium]|nr:winged helix-turn-helix transcriptional regulator [Acidobacteriota bacterium]
MASRPAEFVFEQTISFVLARTSTAFRNSLEKSMATIGLHAGQAFVLIELWKRNGLRQIDIASQLNLAAPTVSKMIKGLVEINLIRVQKVDDDARSTRVFLTDKGLAIRAEVETQWHELEEYTLGDLNETERLILFELLSKLRNTYTGRDPEEDE